MVLGFILAPMLAPIFGAFLGGVLAGATGGLVGGVISGAITGGPKGALMGALMGMAGGAVFGGISQIIGAALTTLQKVAVFGAVGLGVSAATGGWRGMLTFAAGFAGSMLGIWSVGGFKSGGPVRQLSSGREKPGIEFNKGYEDGSLLNEASMPESVEPTRAINPSSKTSNPVNYENKGVDALNQTKSINVSKMVETQNLEVKVVHPSSSFKAIDFVRPFAAAAGVELAEVGIEVMIAGVPLLATGPAGVFAGSFLLIVGGGLAAFGVLTTLEAGGITNYSGANP